MRFGSKRFIVWAAIVAFCVSSTGCSYVGYRMGSGVDKHKSDTKPVSIHKIEKIDAGTVIDVYTLDGRHYTGNFSMVDKDPDDKSIEGIEFFQFFPEPPGQRRITLDELDRVEVPQSKNSRYYFATFGALIDFAIIGIVFVAATQD